MAGEFRVDFSGPFFQHQPGKTLRANIAQMMDALGHEMESDVQGQIASAQGSMPDWTGFAFDHVLGRASSLSGKKWAATAVVSLSTRGLSGPEAVALLASGAGRHGGQHGRAPGIETRFHPFSRTARSVRNSKALLADLAKGIE